MGSVQDHLSDVLPGSLLLLLEAGLRFIQIGSHQHPVIGGNAEQGQKTHPDGHGEVDALNLEEPAHIRIKEREIQEPILPIEPDHQKAAGPGHQNGGKDHHGGAKGAELKIENYHDHQQGQGQDHRQPFLGPDLILVITSKSVGHAGRNPQLAAVDLFLEKLAGLLHHIYLSKAFLLIKEHIAGQKGVFALDHLGAMHVADHPSTFCTPYKGYKVVFLFVSG